MAVARMRTLSKAIEELNARDPSNCYTLCRLRIDVRSGAVPSVKAGSKFLVNMDLLESYLEGSAPPSTLIQASGIRRSEVQHGEK